MYSNLKMGDFLYRTKIMVEHAGIYLGDGKVIHNQPKVGVTVTTFNEYSEGKEVKVIKANSINKQELRTRIRQVLKSNKPYCLLSNNCEHIASLIYQGTKTSSQVKAVILSIILGLIVSKKVDGKNLLKIIAIGGLCGLLLSNLSRSYDEVVYQST